MQRHSDTLEIPGRSYRPEQRTCPQCQSTLARSHIVWRKRLLTLAGPLSVISWGYRCPNAVCPSPDVVYRSTTAEGLHLRKHQFGRDVIVQAGYRRYWQHQTIDELLDWLTHDVQQLRVSRRQVLNLLTDFLALLRAAQPAKLQAQLPGLRQWVLGIDGMQPAKGDTCLYIVRELQLGLTVLAENLDDSSEMTIRQQLLQPLKALASEFGLTWCGIVSDAQETIRTAVAAELPGLPHQACQSHCLREAGALTFAADQNLKKRLKASFRSALKRSEQRIANLPTDDPFAPILADYADALRTTLLAGGVAPFELGGVQVFDDLASVVASLHHCQEKGGLRPCYVV